MNDTPKSQNINKKEEYNPRFDEHLKGLSGWLVIVGIGMGYSLFTNSYFILTNVIDNGGWSILMQPSPDLNLVELNLVPIIVVLLYFLMTILLVHLVILFLFQKRNFPKWYIGLKLFSLIIAALDTYFVLNLLPDNDPLRDQAMLSIILTLVSTLVWIPYMLVSKRVRFTFIN
jgi:hypothetical protein